MRGGGCSIKCKLACRDWGVYSSKITLTLSCLLFLQLLLFLQPLRPGQQGRERQRACWLADFFFIITPVLSLGPLPCCSCGKGDKSPEKSTGQRHLSLRRGALWVEGGAAPLSTALCIRAGFGEKQGTARKPSAELGWSRRIQRSHAQSGPCRTNGAQCIRPAPASMVTLLWAWSCFSTRVNWRDFCFYVHIWEITGTHRCTEGGRPRFRASLWHCVTGFKELSSLAGVFGASVREQLESRLAHPQVPQGLEREKDVVTPMAIRKQNHLFQKTCWRGPLGAAWCRFDWHVAMVDEFKGL